MIGLSAAVEVSGDASDRRVPSLVLQPLVENAVIHGISPARGVGHLWVRVAVDADWTSMEVENTLPEQSVPTGGTGGSLTGIERRLELLYEGVAALSHGPNGDGRFHARVAVPRTEEAQA